MFEKKRTFLILCLIFFTVLLFSNTVIARMDIEDTDERRAENYYRGEVISVEERQQEDDYFREGIEQQAKIKITSGPYEDKVVNIDNLYVEDRQHLNIYLEEGMSVILVAFERDGGVEFHLQDVARDHGLLFLLILFVILLLVVGWIKGLKTLITLVFTGVVIAKFMLPLLLQGYSPIPVTIFSSLLIIVFILIGIGGFNFKSLAAIIGTGVGVFVAGILAFYVGEISYLTGFSSNEAQMLLTGDFTIDIRGLLFAGIIIGSLGAITDVAMSVASSAAEIKKANPEMGIFQLINAAFNVGRDIMGTMANTLILAYVGGSLHLLLLLMRTETDWLRIINMDLIATEVVRGLAGSIGLIVSIPVTALVAAFLLEKVSSDQMS